jgi:hypothetical protein
MKKRSASKPESKSKAGLRPDKVELAKRRIAEGFYSSPVVEGLLIERLLADPQFLKSR